MNIKREIKWPFYPSQVLNTRKVELLLGYFVRRIGKSGDFGSSIEKSEVEEKVNDSEKLIVEVQANEKGAKSQLLEADLVLWTVGNKPLLPELEPNGWPFELPVTGRGQAETDETLQVKGHPRIFAVGDSSALRDSKGKVLPATAQVLIDNKLVFVLEFCIVIKSCL